MSATELDLPVLIAAEQIRRREFVTTRRGYDPDQVRDYLEALADQVDLMASMIREADEAADRFRMEGRRDAERLMTEARTDAERIRTETQATAEEARRQAERALHDAREQADRTIAGLSSRREALVDQLAQMQERLLGVAADLEATIVAPELAAAPDPVAPELAPAPEPNASAPTIVDVRAGDQLTAPPPPMSIEELFADLDEAAREDLWGGTDAMHLDVPDIPPLDLDWGDAADDDPI